MDEWTPVFALPNLDMRGSIECPYAAIVSPGDARILKLRNDHPNLTTFMSKFSDQYCAKMWPSLLLLRTDAPKSYYTPEAMNAFRAIIALSVVTYARSKRLRFDRANGLIFTNTFQFYPWMLDKQYEEMFLLNPLQMHVHLLDKFEGQSFPEQPRASIMADDIDIPLAKELLGRWVNRFSTGAVAWKDKALFRSLNMANEAGRIPAVTAATFYDVGRSLALWVSAYEILAHPGGTGQSSRSTVSAELEKVKWLDPKLAAATHTIPGRAPQQKQLAVWLLSKVYDLRNDFLHGNDVDQTALFLNGQAIIDFAACLYRLVLTGFLDLHFNAIAPAIDNAAAVSAFASERRDFHDFQTSYEDALLNAN